jgi:pyrroloquinoline quinone (PQQ) biosynthesis protein C
MGSPREATNRRRRSRSRNRPSQRSRRPLRRIWPAPRHRPLPGRRLTDCPPREITFHGRFPTYGSRWRRWSGRGISPHEPCDIDRCLTAALAERRLLDHPSYRRWEAGDVTLVELAAYTAQYRHFEANLPGFFTNFEASRPEGPARDLVYANLADELGDPIPHTELFERFAAAVNTEPEPASAATTTLLDTYTHLLDQSPVGGLAGFLAYESQAAEVTTTTKASGLRRHDHLDDHQVSFWDHHSQIDAKHGHWMADALSDTADSDDDISSAVREVADAWWAFIDEREAARLGCVTSSSGRLDRRLAP